MSRLPGADVLRAFGVEGRPVPVTGGQGSVVRVGDVVLKPVSDDGLTDWWGGVQDSVVRDGFRVPRQLPTRDGRWVEQGWSASEHVAGEHRLWGGPWPRAVDACRRFHAAVAHLDRPAAVVRRSDLFARADAVAWSAPPPSSTGDGPLARAIGRLRALQRPVHAPAQVVHADVAGNLLFADDQPPAVIDLAPVWRPGPYGVAVLVVDAVLWYGQGPALADHVRDVPDLDQYLLRALVFRLTVDRLLADTVDRPVRWEDSQVAWDLEHAEPLIRRLEDPC